MVCDASKCFMVCALLIGFFSLSSGSLFAGDPTTVQGKVDPAIKAKVEPVVRALAREFAHSGNLDKEIVFAMLTNYLWKNPGIYGAAFAFAPVKEDGKEIKSSPYVYRSGDKLIEKDLINSYDYTAPDQTWYTVPVKLGKPAWSEPYYDKGGGEAWMITYSVPIYSGEKERRLLGVVTSDVLIPEK